MANIFIIPAITIASSEPIRRELAEGKCEIHYINKQKVDRVVQKVLIGDSGWTWLYFDEYFSVCVPDDTELELREIEDDYEALTNKQRIAIGRLALLTRHSDAFMPPPTDREKHMPYLFGCGYVAQIPLGDWAVKYSYKEREMYQRYTVTPKGKERIKELFPKYAGKKEKKP